MQSDEVPAEGPDEEGPHTALAFLHDGCTLVAERHGAGPPTFVLVHGIGMGRGVFGDLVAHLSGHGTVIALDLPGYGEAPEPPRTPTMERLADLVAAFLRAEGIDDAVLVGHSMGTQVVTEVAARHPGITRRIVLVAPTVNDRRRSAREQLMLLARDLVDESPKVLGIGAREYVRAGPNLGSKVKAMLVHRPEESYPKVRARALVIRGENDPVSPHDWCARVVSLLPDARLSEVAGHGHETMIRDAAPAAAEILRFAAEG